MPDIDWSTVLAAVFSSGVISILVTLWIARDEKSDRKRTIELAERQFRLDQHKERVRLLDDAASLVHAYRVLIDNIEEFKAIVAGAESHSISNAEADSLDIIDRAQYLFADLEQDPETQEVRTGLALLNELVSIHLEQEDLEQRKNYAEIRAKTGELFDRQEKKTVDAIKALRAFPTPAVSVRSRSLLARLRRQRD